MNVNQFCAVTGLIHHHKHISCGPNKVHLLMYFSTCAIGFYSNVFI